MKQTAVEKLELSLLGIISFDSEELRAKYKERMVKAKEMEKQQQSYSEKQMDDSYDKGLKDAIEKMYSEEEVYQLLYDLSGQVLNNKVSNPKLLEKWFNKFKKK